MAREKPMVPMDSASNFTLGTTQMQLFAEFLYVI